MAYWAAIGQIAGEVGTAWLNSDSQHKTNRMNLRLQRENQAWMKDMSNTAIQRRAADIEAAGGNRALAFTNGSEATTPTTTPARMEPARLQAPNIGSAILMAKQADNIQANTQNQTANTRKTTAEARLLEEFGGAERMQGLEKEGWQINKLREETRNAGITADMSAAQLNKFNKTLDDMVAMVKNARTAQDINVTALENIAKLGGVELGKVQPLIKLLLNLFLKGDTK